jgi:hypothetical protein
MWRPLLLVLVTAGLLWLLALWVGVAVLSPESGTVTLERFRTSYSKQLAFFVVNSTHINPLKLRSLTSIGLSLVRVRVIV